MNARKEVEKLVLEHRRRFGSGREEHPSALSENPDLSNAHTILGETAADALSVAHGSIREVETQITIARRQQFTTPPKEEEVLNLASEVGRLVQGLMNSLNRA